MFFFICFKEKKKKKEKKKRKKKKKKKKNKTTKKKKKTCIIVVSCLFHALLLVGWCPVAPEAGKEGGEKKRNVRVVFMLVSRWFHGAGFRPVSCWFQCAVCFHACFMGGFMGPVSCLNFGPVS